jgi:acyl carrier protein
VDIEKEVREFIVENFLYGDRGVPLRIDDSFIEMGIIDSTGVLEIVNFLESRFGITLNDDELTPKNLDSLLKIVTFLDVKLNNRGRAASET